MIPIEFNDDPAFLLTVGPDWVKPVKATVEVIADAVAGLTNRESRRAYSKSLRFSTISYLGIAADATARATALNLRAYKAEPVLMPFWPAVLRWADRGERAFNGLQIVFKDDFTAWELFTDIEPNWPLDDDMVCPVLIGRLTKRELSWVNAATAEVEIEFAEQSAAEYALTTNPQAWENGPKPAAYGAAPHLFPFHADFDGPTVGYSVAIVRTALGFGRQPSETLYPQDATRSHEPSFTESDSARLLAFFVEHSQSAFWVPLSDAAAILTQSPTVGQTVIHVGDHNIQAGDYVQLFTPDGVRACRRVVEVNLASILLDSPPGSFAMEDTLVSHLTLCRFDKSKLSIQWPEPFTMECSIPLVEVPPEVAPGADETLGATIGALPVRAYLYEFRSLGVAYFTSFERSLLYNGHTYQPAKIDHGEIKTGLKLDADEVQVRMEATAGSPLVSMVTLRMEAPLHLHVYQADVAGALAANAARIFTGEVVKAGIKGSIVTGRAVPGGSMFDRKVPRMIFQQGCNHALFSVGCGLAVADWKRIASVQDPGAPGYPFAFVIEDAGVAAENYFAGGWIEFGAGETLQRRAILISTAAVDGVLTVTLDRDPYPFPVMGNPITLYPGCDGTPNACKTVFDNWLNFGGHPFIPIANPSSVKPGASTAGGKK